MKKLVIATRNRGKKREFERLLKGLEVKISDLSNVKTHLPHVIENGKTFRQNAIKKAITFSRYVEGLVVTDDSGLAVDMLGGKPGVRSSRFAHNRATDKENTSKLLRLMEKTPSHKRQATFICVIAIAENGCLLGTAEGKCKGKIRFEPAGRNGFGYDPVFIPRGHRRTFAQLEASHKNRISHRGKALRRAKSIIRKYL